MKSSQKRALTAHRRQQKAKGLIRVEVQAAAGDAVLLRQVAAELRSGTRRAAEVRSLLRRSLRPRKSLRDLLVMDVEVPDAVVDAAFARSRSLGRKVEL